VWVSPNGGHDYQKVIPLLGYVARIVTVSIDPASGPLVGNSEIVVTGMSTLQFRSGASPFCRFGRIEVPLKEDLRLSGMYLCYTPSFVDIGPGMYNMSVILRHPSSKAFEVIMSDILYTYYEPARLSNGQVTPKSGPSRGGTVLQVLGSGFLDTSLLTVRFTVSGNGTDTLMDVHAVYSSDGSLTVITPGSLLVIYFLLLLTFFCTYAFLAGLYGNTWYRFFNTPRL
jgi:hypothetical protein